LRIIQTFVWDEAFFEKFIAFRNEVQQNIINSFPEEISDYTKFFHPDSPFAADYDWQAFMVLEEQKVLAKAILCWKKGSSTGNLGFIDWENNTDAARLLINSVQVAAKEKELLRLKTPVDLNFYVKYRIKLPGGGSPFWGEPVYPDYYHELFRQTGFHVIGEWDTYRLFKIQGIIDYFLKRKKLAKKNDGNHSKTPAKSLRTTIRCVNVQDWDNELRIIYSLFNQAYQTMPEWEAVTYEQFRVIYDDFRYIMNPYYSYIVELNGKPVGFSINFVDPLPILLKVKGKKLNTFQKALLLLKLRANWGTYMIAHVGKIAGPDGEEIKGIQIQVSKWIQLIGGIMPRVLVTFQMKGSPSRRSFEEKSQVPFSQYVLYGMDLK
jgi:hypothetical protein